MSVLGLRPITLAEKLVTLKMMIAKGQIALSARVSMDTIKHELQKPEHDGLGISQIVNVLKEKKLVQTPKTPAAVYKLSALAPGL